MIEAIRQFMREEQEVAKIIIMTFLGLVGGTVRICGVTKPQTFKTMISGMMASGFAGMLTGIFLHSRVTDPIYLSGLAAVGGYGGQLFLVLIVKIIEHRAGLKITITEERVKK